MLNQQVIRLKPKMPPTSFEVFATSTEHLLCGMHSVKDAIGCNESADELKTLGLNFMRDNPTVALNDADQTPTIITPNYGGFKKRTGLNFGGYTESNSTSRIKLRVR